MVSASVVLGRNACGCKVCACTAQLEARRWLYCRPTSRCCKAGPDSYALGYDELVKALLGEAQLHQHLHQRTVVWLTAIRPLIQVPNKRMCHSRASVWLSCEQSQTGLLQFLMINDEAVADLRFSNDC